MKGEGVWWILKQLDSLDHALVNNKTIYNYFVKVSCMSFECAVVN